MQNLYTVYVGGLEVNDYYMTKSEAENLASQYDVDYDDVAIIQIDMVETMQFSIDRGWLWLI